MCIRDRLYPEKAVTVHASITARGFFERRGYRVVREQQIERRGVLLTNFVMEDVYKRQVLRPSGSRLSDPAYLLLSVRPLPVDSAASASSFAVPKHILFNDSSGKVQKIFAGGIPRAFAAPVRWERPK